MSPDLTPTLSPASGETLVAKAGQNLVCLWPLYEAGKRGAGRKTDERRRNEEGERKKGRGRGRRGMRRKEKKRERTGVFNPLKRAQTPTITK